MKMGRVRLAALLQLLLLLLTPPSLAGQVVLASSSSPSASLSSSNNYPEFSRDEFPRGFVFGAGTSAYQAEGAVDEDGRSPSIWDTYTHAGKMPDGSTADVAADAYHKYKAVQRGWVGVNVYTFAFTPLTNSTADVEATQRASDFMMGWIVEPLVSGDYPSVMRKIAGSRIPSFTERQKKQLKGACDFIGLNHYSSSYIADNPDRPKSDLSDFNRDLSVRYAASKNDTPSGQFVPIGIPVDPPGLQRVLKYFKEAYGNPPIYIQENGYGSLYNITLDDGARIDAIKGYVGAILAAIRNGSNARGYFVWSFLDVFELLTGYRNRYGLYYVNFDDKDLKRQPKLSALWYRDFLVKKKLLATS